MELRALAARVRLLTLAVMLLGIIVVGMAASMLFQAVIGVPTPGSANQVPQPGPSTAAPEAQTVRLPERGTAAGPELTSERVAQMSQDEARKALAEVSRARRQPDLDQATRDRLKREFDALLDRLKAQP